MASDILEKIRPANEVSPYLRGLIYGEPKTGKTVLACGNPNTLLVCCDSDGHSSLLNHNELRDTSVFRVQGWEELLSPDPSKTTLLDELRKGSLPDKEIIVLDPITELQKKNLDYLLKKARMKDMNRSLYLPFQQDYNESTQMIRSLIIALQDLPRHVLFVAHSIVDKDGMDGHFFYRPALTPKVAETIVGLMSFIGYMDYDEDTKERTLQLQPTRKIQAGTRIGGLPGTIKNPHISMIFDAHKKMLRAQETLKEVANA